ncbi:hypothetical protein V6N13_059867 [Hibiscus sabdariffa]
MVDQGTVMLSLNEPRSTAVEVIGGMVKESWVESVEMNRLEWGKEVLTSNVGRVVQLNEAYKQSNPPKKKKTLSGVAEGAAVVSLVEGRAVSNVSRWVVSNKGSNSGLHEVVRIEENDNSEQGGTGLNESKLPGVGPKNLKENVRKGLKVRKPSEGRSHDRHALSEWVQNTIRQREDFGATDGSTPVHLHDSDADSWMEHSSEDEDRMLATCEANAHTQDRWNEPGHEGRQ